MPLKRVKTLHPHPCLKHIALRVDGTGDGDCEYGGRIMILKGAEGFICKGSDPYPIYIESKPVAFNLCKFPISATDKMIMA